MKRIDLRYLWLFAAMILASCSGGGIGCGGCATACGGNANYKFSGTPLKNGIRTRMTQEGVNFITQNLKPIIEGILARSGQNLDCNGTGIPVPDQTFGNSPDGKTSKPSGSNCTSSYSGVPGLGGKAICTGPLPASGNFWYYGKLANSNFCGRLDTNSVQIALNESDQSITVSFSIPEIQVRVGSPEIGICGVYRNVPVAGGDACGNVNTTLQNVQIKLTNLSGSIKFQFVTNPQTGQVGLQVANNGIKIGGSTRFTFNANCSSLKIGLVTIPIVNYTVTIDLGSGFCNTLINIVEGIINNTGFLQPFIFGQLSKLIENQVKQFNLLADAKAEMEIPLASALGGLGLPGMEKAGNLGLLMRPGDALGIVRGGLNLGLDSGFESEPPNRCVPVRPSPVDQPGPAPQLNGQFHLGAALSRSAANRAMWGTYHTGLLCLTITSTDVFKLSGGAFPLNAGILALLAPNLTKVVPQDAPIMITAHPEQAPRVEFGTGQQVGGKTDSTIQLFVPDFGLSFFVMLHDRYVRLFRLNVDMRLGASLIVTPTNALEVTIDTDNLSLTNARVANANLVDTNDINSLLPTILTLLTQVLGNSKISFPVDLSQQISNALGVPIGIKIDAIERDGAAQDWLAMKMTMTNNGIPLLPEVRTEARLHDKPGLYNVVKGQIEPTGEVLIQVPEMLGPNKLEYQYYVDFGAWSSFQPAPGGILKVRNAFLKLVGKHTVWLRARIQGEYRSLEERPVSVEFTFDPVAPIVGLSIRDRKLVVTASDAVTLAQNLRYEIRRKGIWEPLPSMELEIDDLVKEGGNVLIRVTDEAGNQRTVKWSTQTQALTGDSQTTGNAVGTGAPPVAMGCSALPFTAPFGLPFLLLLLPFFFRRRR